MSQERVILRDWTVVREGAVKRIAVPSLPCGHPVLLVPEWIGADGRFLGRIGCPAPCRRVYDDVVLENYTEAALRV